MGAEPSEGWELLHRSEKEPGTGKWRGKHVWHRKWQLWKKWGRGKLDLQGDQDVWRMSKRRGKWQEVLSRNRQWPLTWVVSNAMTRNPTLFCASQQSREASSQGENTMPNLHFESRASCKVTCVLSRQPWSWLGTSILNVLPPPSKLWPPISTQPS